MLKTIDQNTVAYEESGSSSDCLVVLQGWGTSFSLYDGVVERLSASYRVVSFDLPGFGASPEPAEPWSVSQYADFVVEFVSSLNVDRVAFFAHSFGGRIVLELAGREELPFSIDGLYLCDVAGIMPERTSAQKSKIARYKMLRSIANVGFVYAMFPDLIDDWRSRQGSRDYRAASPLMKQVLVKAVNYDQSHLLGMVNCPTCIIWGQDDQDTPVAFAETMHGQIASSTLTVIPGAGHFPFLEDPDAFYAALDAGMKYVRGGGHE